MANFMKLRARQHDEIVSEFFSATEAAESGRTSELVAARRIQSAFRGHVVRKDLRHKSGAAATIQHAFHRFQAAVRVDELRKQRDANEAGVYYGNCATLIQKMYRGYFSRKYHHNFAARKAYIQRVKEAGERLREESAAQYGRQLEETIIEQDDKDFTEFKNLTKSLHHLLSTKSVPGVYNNPYAGPATAFDRPVEDHLRDTAKELYETQAYGTQQAKYGAIHSRSTTGALSRASGKSGRSSRSQGPFKTREAQEASIRQAQRKYGSVVSGSSYADEQQALKDKERASKMARVSDQPMITASSPREIHHQVHSSGPYVETTRNPLQRAEDKTKRVSEKPFVLATPAQGKDFVDY